MPSFRYRALHLIAALLHTAADTGAVKVDTAAYRAAALDAQRTTGELLPVCVIVPAFEHFGVSFGKDSHDSHGKEADEAAA